MEEIKIIPPHSVTLWSILEDQGLVTQRRAEFLPSHTSLVPQMPRSYRYVSLCLTRALTQCSPIRVYLGMKK